MRFLHLLSICATLAVGPDPVARGEEPKRLLTLGGPTTEIVYALGAGDHVVAVDSSSLYPEEAAQLPKVGYVSAVGTEGLLSQRPDLIIATSRLGPPAVVEQLKTSDVPLLIVESPHDEPSLHRAIDRIGAVLARESEAEELWETIARDLDKAKAKAQQFGEPSAVFLLGTSGTAMAAGSDTQGAGILTLAGGHNLFDGYTGYKPVSEEALLVANPDFIFVGSHGGSAGTTAREQLDALGMGRLASATEAEVRKLDLGEYLIFGPRTGGAALRLAEIFAEGSE